MYLLIFTVTGPRWIDGLISRCNFRPSDKVELTALGIVPAESKKSKLDLFCARAVKSP